MCGIVGLVGVDASPESLTGTVTAMTERIRHRGPDGGGVVTHADATLGMTRLAIVDVAHGHQPMATEDGSVVLVFNGEIYNAPAIRQALERLGVPFRTRSDTEVLLRLYERYPDDIEAYLVGMWAFAIHDRRRRRIILSRDRFGIKPLFVADTGTALAFASELRAFDRDVVPFARLFAIDHAAAHAMVSWSYVPEDRTIYAGVRRLPPASRLTIDLATGARAERVYWRLEPSADAGTIQTLDMAMDGVAYRLRRAVKEHLESDVPVATFLSGGIDSSLVTAFGAHHPGRPLQAYTLGFPEAAFDESAAAVETAARIGVPLHVHRLDPATAWDALPDALLAYDEPFGDSSSLATYVLCQAVSRDYKVALSGDGGDEVFGGYRKYQAPQIRRLGASWPRLRDILGRAVEPWHRTLGTVLQGSDAEVYARLSWWAPLAETARALCRPAGGPAFEDAARGRFSRATGTELQRTLAADLGSMLTNDMLVKVDRASMACGLEVRVPFLDHRLVEFGVGLPERFTVGHGRFRGKRVLRALHARRFGADLAGRPKQGFSIPVRTWLQGPFAPACARLFEKARLDRFGILSSHELSAGGFERWVAGENPLLAWHVFALAAWCEATLGDGPDALRELLTSRPGALRDGVLPAIGQARVPADPVWGAGGMNEHLHGQLVGAAWEGVQMPAPGDAAGADEDQQQETRRPHPGPD